MKYFKSTILCLSFLALASQASAATITLAAGGPVSIVIAGQISPFSVGALDISFGVGAIFNVQNADPVFITDADAGLLANQGFALNTVGTTELIRLDFMLNSIQFLDNKSFAIQATGISVAPDPTTDPTLSMFLSTTTWFFTEAEGTAFQDEGVNAFAAQYNFVVASAISPDVITPEPASAGLIGAGLILGCLFVKRCRASSRI